jgi:hypothetical protein
MRRGKGGKETVRKNGPHVSLRRETSPLPPSLPPSLPRAE